MTDRVGPYLKKVEACSLGQRRVAFLAAHLSSFQKYAPVGLALAMTPAVSAEPWACTFTAECVAGGACGEAAFEMQVIAADHEGELFFRTASGATSAVTLTDPGALPATYAAVGQAGLAEMLTIEDDSTALFTLHIFDGSAQAATYFGTCEELG